MYVKLVYELCLSQPFVHALRDLFWVCSGKEMAEFQIEPEITLDLMMAANYLYT